MGRYYSYIPYYRGDNRIIGPLLPFVGGLLVGGLITPRPNYYQQIPYYSPQYYQPMGYYQNSNPYPNTNQYSDNYIVNNADIPTYYTSVNTDTTNIYPYYTNPRY